MLKKIFINEELLIYLFIMFMFAVISLIRYCLSETVEQNEIHEIKVILSSKPEYYNGGEYSDPELSFEAEDYAGTFKINGYDYAYKLYQKEAIQKLQIGDSLKLLVSSKAQKSADDDIEIIGIEDYNKGKLLTLDEYNHQQKNKWKDIWFIVLFFSLVFWPMIIRKWIKEIRAVVRKN